jgi:hypothetical protein
VPVTRTSIRSTVLFAASVALTAGLLSGCGAGQVTQTEAVRPPISGVNVDSADGTIGLRNLAIAYRFGGYPRGGTAPLRVDIVNSGQKAVRLVEVTTDVGTVVWSAGSAAPSPSAAPAPSPSSAAPPPSVAPSVSASNGHRSASPSAAASGAPASGSPAASEAASPSPAAVGSPQINIEISPGGLVALAAGAARYLQITGLTKAIRPPDTVMLTFRFDNGATVSTPVPVDVPLSPLPRSPLPLEAD